MNSLDASLLAALGTPAAFAVFLFLALRWFAYVYWPEQKAENKENFDRMLTAHERNIAVITAGYDRNSVAIDKLAESCLARRIADASPKP
jgi:hypothetical protein